MLRSIFPPVFLVLSVVTALSCKSTGSHSRGKIVEGEEDYSSYPSTVGLAKTLTHDFLGSTKEDWCTGTVVRDDLILTAAHCIKAAPRSHRVTSIRVFDRFSGGELANKNISSQTFITFPSPRFNSASPLSILNADVAFLVYPKGTFAHIEPAKIAKETPAVGAKLTFIGYGKTDVSREPTNPEHNRYIAYNSVFLVEPLLADAIISRSTAATKATSVLSAGDSGSGIYNDQGEIVAILTGGGFSKPGPIQDKTGISPEHPFVNFGGNVNNQNIRKFIDAVMNDPAPSERSGQDNVPTTISPDDFDSVMSKL